MAGHTFKDRLYTRRVAHAMTSPVGILATGGGLAVGIGLGLALPAILVLGGVGWSVPVAVAIQRSGPRSSFEGSLRSRRREIDPSALQEPWRSHVLAALASQTRVRERVGSTRSGPLRDNLREISDRVDVAVDESWQVAQRGEALTNARRAIDTQAIDQMVRDLEERLGAAPDDARLGQALDAGRKQRAVADRMDEVIGDTDTRLRVLDARIGEVVVRAVELSTYVEDDVSLGDLSSDVNSLVGEMEALRLALDETQDLTSGLPSVDPG